MIDLFEELSPEAQKIVFVVEYSIARSGRVALDSELPQRRDFYINFLWQGEAIEVTKEVKIPAGPCWYVGPHWWTDKGEDKGKGAYAKKEKLLRPMEMAEAIISDELPDETTQILGVIVSPNQGWSRPTLDAAPKIRPSLVKSIIEVIDYYGESGRPDYGYPLCLLRECLRRCPARYVMNLYEEALGVSADIEYAADYALFKHRLYGNMTRKEKERLKRLMPGINWAER